MATAPLFRGTHGLNNAVNPKRLKMTDDGRAWLAKTKNVVIDDSGAIQRAPDRVNVFDSPAHSIWADGEFCFFVSEGDLYRRFASGNNTKILSGVTDQPMRFERVGGVVYAVNGFVSIAISDTEISGIVATEPVHSRGESRVFGFPQGVRALCWHRDRMFAATSDGVWQSEPFEPTRFDMASGVMGLCGVERMVSVGGGIYLVATNSLYFAANSSMADFKFREFSIAVESGSITVAESPNEGSDRPYSGKVLYFVADGIFYFANEDGFVGPVKELHGLKFTDILCASACSFENTIFFTFED